VEGVVKQFRWANPHSWIELEVVNGAGKAELWNFEMLPPNYLVPAGWTRSSIKAGDRVKVTANVSLTAPLAESSSPSRCRMERRSVRGVAVAGGARGGGAGGAGDTRGGRGQ
jgi:hypothetical protein